MNEMKALFHINETEKWKMVLANMNNLITDVGIYNVIIELVVNGAAVSVFRFPFDETLNNELTGMERLAGLGVKFAICRNSLAGMKINEEHIPSFAAVVSAGVTELIRRQQEGYSYI